MKKGNIVSNATDNILLKCEKCYDTNYIVDINVDGSTFICICDECISKNTNTYSEEMVTQAKTKCKKINDLTLDPDDKSKFLTYLKQINTKREYENIHRALNLFLERYPEIKRKNKHLEILKNPHNFRIVRPIDEHQFTALHLLTRNQVFQIISDENRKKYTKISEINGEVIDIPVSREFIGWGGNLHFEISGPVLCDHDQSVFDACVKLWHEKCHTGITIETNLSEIWKTMGNKSKLSKNNRESLRRSLSRLHKVSIEVKSMDKHNRSFWGGGIVDTVMYTDSSENKVMIKLNLHMAANYLQGSYATLNHDIYKILSSYAKKIYLFLMSHDNPIRQISLEKLKPLIGVDDKISKQHFKKYVNKALKELQDNNVLEQTSKIENEIFYTAVQKEAWDARPTSNPQITIL